VPEWVPLVSAGVVATVGGFATYYFGKIKEDRTRRLELRIKYLQRQIEEFYGPLYNLITEMVVSKQVLDAIATTEGSSPLSTDQNVRVKVFVREAQMKPLHDQIIAILRSKLYLVEERTAPPSFHEYLRHAIQERLQREIWSNLKIGTTHIRGRPFPEAFQKDIESGLLTVMRKYDDTIAELYPRRALNKQRVTA
jgi:hypothetical protein